MSSLLIVALCLLCCDVVAAPPLPTLRRTTHSTLFGIGGTRQQDTYLSPLNYRGTQLNFVFETQRQTHLLDSCVSFQTLLQADLSKTANDPLKANYLGGIAHFDATWHFRLIGPATIHASSASSPVFHEGSVVDGSSANATSRPFRLALGPQIGTSIGGLYNTRNGNNPAQAIAEVHLSASAALHWHFRLWKQPFILRDQVDIPLLGLMFSPAYGQSYYELFSLNNYDHNIRFTHPINGPSLRNLLTIDLPLRRCTLRVGYLADFRQSQVHDIRRHTYTHAFLIGWVRELTIHRPTNRPTK